MRKAGCRTVSRESCRSPDPSGFSIKVRPTAGSAARSAVERTSIAWAGSGRHPEAVYAVDLVDEFATVLFDHFSRCHVVGIAGNQGALDAELAGDRQRVVQHRGGVALSAGRRSHVISDVAAYALERWRQPVPDCHPAKVFRPIAPPQRRSRYVAGRSGRLLPPIGNQLRNISREFGWLTQHIGIQIEGISRIWRISRVKLPYRLHKGHTYVDGRLHELWHVRILPPLFGRRTRFSRT